MNLHILGQLIYNKGVNNMQREKDSLFKKWCWENWIHMEKNETGPLFYTTQKNQLKMDERLSK